MPTATAAVRSPGDEMTGTAGPSFVAIGLGFAAGVILFLHGVGLLSDALAAVAGERTRRILTLGTGNRPAGVAVGAASTAVLDSSSSATTIVVGLVHARVMNLRQAMVLGANVGATASRQVYALDLDRWGRPCCRPG